MKHHPKLMDNLSFKKINQAIFTKEEVSVEMMDIEVERTVVLEDHNCRVVR